MQSGAMWSERAPPLSKGGCQGTWTWFGYGSEARMDKSRAYEALAWGFPLPGEARGGPGHMLSWSAPGGLSAVGLPAPGFSRPTHPARRTDKEFSPPGDETGLRGGGG